MKDILFIEPNNNTYGTESLEKALGGSETVFILLTECLKKVEGINLDIVFNDTFKNFIETNKKEYDLIISYRSPAPLFNIKGKINAVYLQDMPNQHIVTMINILVQQGRLNKLIFLSHYQKIEYLKLLKGVEEGRHCLMLDNCIDTSLFDSGIEKKNEFIYASAPNRGLEILLEMWSEIHKQLPGYVLKIAGSTSMYNVKSNDPSVNEEREKFLEIGKRLYNQNIEGVKWLGGLNHTHLILELEKSKALLYPSTFPETNCHLLNLALHAGCVPVVSSVGALAEKVINGDNGIAVPGNPYSDEFKQLYVKSVVGLVKSGSIERMIHINRGNYGAISAERIANRLVTQLLNFEEYEGVNTRVLGVTCTDRTRKEDFKINFRNLIWYSPIDMITHELSGMPLDHARETAASMAVHMNADWLLFIDDDIFVDKYFLPDIIKKAQEHGADVVVCNYPYKENHSLVPSVRLVDVKDNKAVNCYELTEQEANDPVKYRFVTAGLGAVLIKTDILRKLGRPYFKTQSLLVKQTGEDSYFFQECHSIGAKIYLALDIPIMHGDRGKPEDVVLIKPQMNKNDAIIRDVKSEDSRPANIIRYCNKYMLEKGKVVDLGCGDCQISNALIKYFDVTKADIKGGEGIIKHNFENPPYPFESESFDGVVCSEVLEHLYNPHVLINESFRILKQNGIMILTVPNFNSIDNMLNFYQNLAYTSKYQMVIEHIRHYNVRSIKEIINGKFEIIEITGNSPNMNPFFDHARKVLGKYVNEPDQVIGECFPDSCMGILFVLRKKEMAKQP